MFLAVSGCGQAARWNVRAVTSMSVVVEVSHEDMRWAVAHDLRLVMSSQSHCRNAAS
jgi:hypothetical protein